MREAADLAPDPARAVRAALEYGRTLLHANRPAEAVEVLQGAAAALSGGDPDLAEQINAELIASSRRLAEY